MMRDDDPMFVCYKSGWSFQIKPCSEIVDLDAIAAERRKSARKGGKA